MSGPDELEVTADELAHAIQCPACGAPPGYNCSTKSGRRATHPHRARRRRALFFLFGAAVAVLVTHHAEDILGELERKEDAPQQH